MSRYQSYPQGQWPGGYDEGRAWAPRNPNGGRYSGTETDPPEASMVKLAPMSRIMPGGDETFKRPAQYSGEDITGDPLVKRSRLETGYEPVKGQGQDGNWRCTPNYEGKLFVFNLMLKTTASDLFQYFVQFGDLKSYVVFRNSAGKSEGRGRVQYVHDKAAMAAVDAQPHFIHGKQIFVSFDRKSGDPKRNYDLKLSLEKHKLYVSDIPLHVTEDDLCEYFSQWGNVCLCNISEKRTKSKKFGFIAYTNYEDAAKCLNTTHSYGESFINVQVAQKSTTLKDPLKEQNSSEDVQKGQQMNQLFVTNIPDEVTPEELVDHFSVWGSLSMCKFAGKVKENNYFGFVSYKKCEDALTALIMPHSLKHQKVYVRVADNGPLVEVTKDPVIMTPIEEKAHKCFLHVNNLNPLTTKDEVYEYFIKYGRLASCLLYNGVAYLAYVNQVDAERCSEIVHILDNRKLIVRFSTYVKLGVKGNDSDSQKSDAQATKPARLDGPGGPHRHASPPRHARRASPPRRAGRASPPRHPRRASPPRHAGPARDVGPTYPIAQPTRSANPANPGLGPMRAYEAPRPSACYQPAAFAGPTIPARPAYPVPQNADPIVRKLRISGLAVHTSEFELLCYFIQWGKIVDLEVVKDAILRPTGCAFATFERLDDAEKAVLAKPHVIDDKEVEVSYANPPKNLLSEKIPSWRQSTSKPLIPGWTQEDCIPDMPLATEYECNVSGCSFTGKSEQFEGHWTKIHEAKVVYLICSFCTLGCVDADDLCEHLTCFHGVEDRNEISTFLHCAKRHERDNIHFVMPGSVTKETCMKVKEPPQKKDAKDISGLGHLRCPKCLKVFMKKDFLLIHIKNQHQNTEVQTEEIQKDIGDNFEESQEYNFGSSVLERAYHELQRGELPRLGTGLSTISNVGSRSDGNWSMQAMPRTALSAPLQPGLNVTRPQVPILPTQQPDPGSDPTLLASQVPIQQAVPLHGHGTPFFPSTVSVPKPLPPHPTPPAAFPPFLQSGPQPGPQPFIQPALQVAHQPVPHFVGTSVAPTVGTPLQLPLSGQMITPSACTQPPQFVMEQPPVSSRSVTMPSEDPNSIPKVDEQDLIDVEMGNVTPQSHESQSEPEMVTGKRANEELKRSVQSGSVLALSPEWTKTLKVAHPKKSSLNKNKSEKKSEVKFIPKFDRTHAGSIQKFLLWSHIMMERLESFDISIRRRLKATHVADGDVAEGDNDPEEILVLSSDEETGAGKVR